MWNSYDLQRVYYRNAKQSVFLCERVRIILWPTVITRKVPVQLSSFLTKRNMSTLRCVKLHGAKKMHMTLMTFYKNRHISSKAGRFLCRISSVPYFQKMIDILDRFQVLRLNWVTVKKLKFFWCLIWCLMWCMTEYTYEKK